MIRIGLNGFGRIGRILTRIVHERDDMEIVAINSRADTASHAHLLTYDSTYGTWDTPVTYTEDSLDIGGSHVGVGRYDHPRDIPRDTRGVNCVIDATGKFKDKAALTEHMKPGVKKVIFTAPGKDLDATIVLGVNEQSYNPEKHHIISNASCTTNGVGPILKVLDEEFGVEHATFCTVHAVTGSQNILDNSHRKNLRIARSYGDSIIPTTTGASKAVGLIMPQLEGEVHGYALRVPTATVSFIDLVVQTNKPVSHDLLTSLLKEKQNDYIGINELPLVSIDYKKNTHSGIVDLPLTQVMGENLLKLCIRYDNERGYACRVSDLVKYVCIHD